MKQIKTLSNSFALIETDGNGKVLTQFGFRKGGLSYFIRNNNVKFYLTEDFFYKNVVWSADAPLMIDGIPYDIDALPDALKKIFILEDEGGGGDITVDQTLSTASTNPIGNQAVAHAVNDLDEAVSDRYTKTETNSLLDNKLDVSAYTPTDLSQYWTSGETQSAITEATAPVNNTLTAHTADTSVHVTSQEKTYWNNKLDASAYTPTDLSNYYTKGQTDGLLDEKLDVTAYTPTDLSNYYTKGETDGVVNGAVSGKADTTYVNQIAAQATEAITALTQTVSNNYTELKGSAESLNAEKFGDVRYDSATHRINFYAHGNSPDILAYVDASDFIKDGMVSNVEISEGNLVITFNSDAGKQPISIPLTDIFNPANYYTTAQTQSYVSEFTYDKATIDQKVAEGGTFDPDLYYDKTATDALLAAKADTATTYTKTEVDTALGNKADTSAVTAVANDVSTLSGAVDTKQDALQYYNEDTSSKEAYINIEDTEFTSTTTFNAGGIDLSVTNNDNGTLYNGYATVNDAGVQMAYDLVTGSDETDAHSFLDVNDGGVSAEVYKNEETTTFNVSSSGVTINNERVLTESDGVYYINFATLTTQGIHDADWDGMVNAINAHRPIYAGLGGEYYVSECLAQSGNQIILTASNHLAHFIYTFTKNGSENYSFTSETREYVTQAEKTAWNTVSGKADTSAVTAVANDVQTVSGQVQTKVATSDFNTYTAATETALNGKVDTSALNDYYTKTEVYNKTEVDAAYETAYQALTAHTADTTVHVTSAEKTTWNNKSDFSGDYNDLTNKPTIPTVPTNISDFTNDAGYITNADITGKADTSAVTTVNDALTGHTADTTVHVTSAQKTAWNGAASDASDALTALGGLSFLRISQSEYDYLVQNDMTDSDTLYIIDNTLNL